MRKLVFLTVIALVVLSVVPAAAKRVVNESYKEFQVQANMGSESEHTNVDGGAWGISGNNGTALGIDYDYGFDCWEGPTDDLAYLSIHGNAELDTFVVNPTKGKTKFMTGIADGMFTDGSYQGQLCDETELNGELAGMTLTIEMDGTGGSLVKTTDSNSWHVAGESNFHRNDRGLNRMAYGTVDIEGLLEWTGEGSIGRHSWSRHSNE